MPKKEQKRQHREKEWNEKVRQRGQERKDDGDKVHASTALQGSNLQLRARSVSKTEHSFQNSGFPDFTLFSLSNWILIVFTIISDVGI
jgi:hypothetical protein